MKLTPLDIKRHQFEKGFRGYDPDEVDGFLKQVADRFEALQEEIRLAHERTRETEAKLQHYERVELALQEALESAKETARRSEEDAARRAAVIVEEAELRAHKITQEAERERFGMRKDLIALSARQAEVAARLRGFLMSELQIVSDFQGDDRHGLLQLDDAPELLLDGPVEAEPSDADASAAEDPDDDWVSASDAAAEEPAESHDAEALGDAEWADVTPDDPDSDRDPEAAPPTESLDAPDSPESNDQAGELARTEAETEESQDEAPAEHVVMAPPPSTEIDPLSPDESGIVGPSRPVEARRATPQPMPADPWTIPAPTVASSDEERERIRRILEDLD